MSGHPPYPISGRAPFTWAQDAAFAAELRTRARSTDRLKVKLDGPTARRLGTLSGWAAPWNDMKRGDFMWVTPEVLDGVLDLFEKEVAAGIARMVTQ